MGIDETLTAFAQALDRKDVLPFLIAALALGAMGWGLWWVVTRPRRAMRMLMRRVTAARS